MAFHRQNLRVLAIFAALCSACPFPFESLRPKDASIDSPVMDAISLTDHADHPLDHGADATTPTDGADVSECGMDRCAVSPCANCPSYPNAAPACVDNNCSFTCDTGFADCDQMMSNGCETDLSSPNDCGACGRVCPTSTPLCNGAPGSNTCATGCSAPTPDRCGSTCTNLANDPNHCGACTTTCAGATGENPTCADAGCSFVCQGGYHLCGSMCASNSSPATCGTSCSACPAPANGVASCDGTNCGIMCSSGYHNCGGTCVSNNSTSHCGTSCGGCPMTFNGTPTCDGTNCGLNCNAGYHTCGNRCANNNSIASCGTSCSSCPAPPPNSTATCNGTQCGSMCNTGYHSCGGACVSNSDPANCGMSCSACSGAPANATTTCDGTNCGFMCDGGYTMSCGSCVPNTTPCNACDGEAQVVTPNGGRSGGTTSGASNTQGSCGGANAPEAVFKLVLTQASDVFATTHGTTWNTVLYMRQSCCDGTEIACNDDADNRTTSVIQQSNLGAGTYYIYVDGFSSTDMGAFTLDVYATPTSPNASDNCGNVTRITQAGVQNMSNCNYNDDDGPTCTCTDDIDLVYYFVLDSPTMVSFDTCENTCIDTILSVRDVCTNQGSEEACDDDGCAATGSCYPAGDAVQSQVSVMLSAGAHYVWIDQKNQPSACQSCGTFSINTMGLPP